MNSAALHSRNALALAAGQSAWDAACPQRCAAQERAAEAYRLREAFRAAMAGDVTLPARWANDSRPWATSADVLASVLCTDASLMRLAMLVLTRAATQDGDETAAGVIALAARQWAEENA